MLQVSSNLFSALLAQIHSLYERFTPVPPEAAPAGRPNSTKEIAPLRLTAGFNDPRLAHRVGEVTAAEALLSRDPASGLMRRQRVLNLLHRAAAAGRPFDPNLLADILKTMNSPASRDFLHRWGRGEFYVHIARDQQMDERLRRAGYQPAGQISFYAPAAARDNAPWIFLRELPAMAKTNAKPDAEHRLDWVQTALERLLGAFHEEDHFRQFSGHFDSLVPGAKPFSISDTHRTQFLVTETMSLLREYQIRLSLGDRSIGEEAARRQQTVTEYLCSCAAADVPGDWFSRCIERLKRIL